MFSCYESRRQSAFCMLRPNSMPLSAAPYRHPNNKCIKRRHWPISGAGIELVLNYEQTGRIMDTDRKC